MQAPPGQRGAWGVWARVRVARCLHMHIPCQHWVARGLHRAGTLTCCVRCIIGKVNANDSRHG